MITLGEFRALCLSESAEEIVERVLLVDDALHVSPSNRADLSASLSATFGLNESSLKLWIVGSAKLGFSISEKRKNRQVLARYRPFTALSDIDTAVVSADLFRLIWDELSIYAHAKAWMPWDSGVLGDYMIHGWLRPDHFPRRRLRRCDDWGSVSKIFK